MARELLAIDKSVADKFFAYMPEFSKKKAAEMALEYYVRKNGYRDDVEVFLKSRSKTSKIEEETNGAE